MAGNDALRRLALVVRAENDALAAGDAAGAAALLGEKLAAAAAVTAMLPQATPTEAEMRGLRDALRENGARLTLAIEVQARIMELVGRAARRAFPAGRYGRGGAAALDGRPVALAVRA